MPDIFLYQGEATSSDIKLRDPTVLAGLAAITATAAITEADDTVSSTAAVLVRSTAAITEAADSVAATATVLVRASVAITEASDSIASTATVLVQASAAITEADDTLVATASVPVIEVIAPVVEIAGSGGFGAPVSRRAIRKLLQEFEDEKPRVAVFSAVSVDTLSASALVGKAALAAVRGETSTNDDEEAIMVLLLAA